MIMDLKSMSGEELLLLSVVDGPKVQDLVDRELDRRAWFGLGARVKRRATWVEAEPRHAA